MRTITDYISKTESAVQKLYLAIDSYYIEHSKLKRPAFTFSGNWDLNTQTFYENWFLENKIDVDSKIKLDESLAEEFFAISTLHGAILQFASMAIEMYSNSTETCPNFSDLFQNNNKICKFNIGHEINTVPIGLIIYAGRNQSSHYDDKSYAKITTRVFEKLSHWHSDTLKMDFIDERFDLKNDNITNYSSYIIWLLGWQTYNSYKNGILQLLEHK